MSQSQCLKGKSKRFISIQRHTSIYIQTRNVKLRCKTTIWLLYIIFEFCFCCHSINKLYLTDESCSVGLVARLRSPTEIFVIMDRLRSFTLFAGGKNPKPTCRNNFTIDLVSNKYLDGLDNVNMKAVF